ncbi:thiaminase II/PqqC family protein [Pyrobaculum calidifontis]|uniref:Transcriptional activator, TenA family n=1 Tax=Pyrobaculum calidifontis (strain DSM 21063 / JCM 11548 / VA1) TaxID=410359 RepID=A3MXD9_PYRCJ|nr:TenA family transcriptional regulator [Pyrobaculum calidifontis]ABO09306.1 transcriptional activator, TenA family [Pyrobaculum calidifontis JCM 11548]
MTSIIEAVRKEVEHLNREIAKAVERPSWEMLRRFVQNQLYIVPHDLKALSVAMAKARAPDEYTFVKMLVDGDYAAYNALLKLAEELRVEFRWRDIDPAAVAYTHFLSWLALHGTLGDLAVALVVNLPVWGANCLKLAEWARANGVKHVEFLEIFKGPYHELERLAEEVARRYEDMEKYIYVAKAIQRYELDFWRAIASSI